MEVMLEVIVAASRAKGCLVGAANRLEEVDRRTKAEDVGRKQSQATNELRIFIWGAAQDWIESE
jgi:hypothetical protein